MPFSPELKDLATNEAMLRQVADITNGRWLDMDPQTDKVYDHNLPPTKSRRPAWDWTVAWLLLPLFLLDVAARRLASWLALSIVVEILLIVVLLFGAGIIYTTWWSVLGVLILAELVGWSIRFRYIGPLFDWMTHTVTALSRTSERSAASLEQLKSVRDRVRGAGSEASGETREPPAQDVPTPSAKARFDAGEPASGKPVDLRDTLGGAKAEPKSTSTGDAKSKSKEETAADDMTSRLLKAKKRAQKRIDDKDKPGEST
jgi:hypothetical protein